MARTTKTKPEHEEPKQRKVSAGPIREKARTMARLVATVGKVIQKYGYPGLTVANIGKESGLDRKLIYTYFGSLDNLVETYIKEKDFWKSGATHIIEKILLEPEKFGRNDVNTLLQAQFDTVFKDKALQKIIHWELGEKNKILRKISDRREEIGEHLFAILDNDFKDSGVDLRAALAIVVGGIYYLSLHAKSNGSTFCGIDINEAKGKARISSAIQTIVNYSYDAAHVNK